MKFTYILCFTLFLCVGILHSQNQESKENYYRVYDSVVGIESINLLNGKVFVDYYKSNKKQHRFFKTYNFFKGELISNGDPYYNLSLKYDLLEDQLILKPNTTENFHDIILTTENINSFIIDKHHFFNFKNDSSLQAIDMAGFLELLYRGENLSLYKKYYKREKEKIGENKTHFIFIEDTSYFFLYKNKFHEIKSKKTFRKAIPEKEELINTYYKNNPMLLKSNPSQFYKLLCNQLNLSIQ